MAVILTEKAPSAWDSSFLRSLTQKATSSVEAEILLKVRCPPHTIEKSCQFFTLLTHAFESRFIPDIPIKPDDLHVHIQQRSLSSSRFQNLDLEQMKELIFIYICTNQLLSMQNHNLQSCRLQRSTPLMGTRGKILTWHLKCSSLSKSYTR